MVADDEPTELLGVPEELGEELGEPVLDVAAPVLEELVEAVVVDELVTVVVLNVDDAPVVPEEELDGDAEDDVPGGDEVVVELEVAEPVEAVELELWPAVDTVVLVLADGPEVEVEAEEGAPEGNSVSFVHQLELVSEPEVEVKTLEGMFELEELPLDVAPFPELDEDAVVVPEDVDEIVVDGGESVEEDNEDAELGADVPVFVAVEDDEMPVAGVVLELELPLDVVPEAVEPVPEDVEGVLPEVEMDEEVVLTTPGPTLPLPVEVAVELEATEVTGVGLEEEELESTIPSPLSVIDEYSYFDTYQKKMCLPG